MGGDEESATTGDQDATPTTDHPDTIDSQISQTPIYLPDVAESESLLTLEPPPPPAPKTILQTMDVTPFLR